MRHMGQNRWPRQICPQTASRRWACCKCVIGQTYDDHLKPRDTAMQHDAQQRPCVDCREMVQVLIPHDWIGDKVPILCEVCLQARVTRVKAERHEWEPSQGRGRARRATSKVKPW
jgi:hypothetical protein